MTYVVVRLLYYNNNDFTGKLFTLHHIKERCISQQFIYERIKQYI